jgi:hypothetical protein
MLALPLAISVAIAALTVTAAPFALPNGFPQLSDSALQQVYEVSDRSLRAYQLSDVQAAGGTLPNTPLPTSLPADAVTTLQVIAYNEIFEVAFFSSLLANVTDGVDGYTDLPMDKDYIISILTAVVAVSRLVRIQAIRADFKTARRAPCSRRQRHFEYCQRYHHPGM